MRICHLHLKAFGPFTDRTLAFPGSEGDVRPGLCVVYGSNELGKTSALRAIRDLFYGIPAQSPDDFEHAYDRMRIGAEIVFEDGEAFAFMRRKGRKDTLIGLAQETVSTGAAGRGETPTQNAQLDALVRAIPEDVFRNFYGLTHEALSRGSEALLEDEGELGRALFAAGLGAGNLRSVLAGLDQEAEALFKPRGKMPRLNASLAEVKELQSSIKAKALKPSAWQEAEREAVEKDEQLARLESQIEALRTESVRFSRIRQTRPALGRLRRAQEDFEPLEGFRELEGDFESRLRDVRSRAEQSRRERDRALESLAHLAERLAGLDLSPELLAQRAEIESLGERIGAHRDRVDQLPRRQADLSLLDETIESILASIVSADTPATRAGLRACLSRSARIRELATDFVGTETRLAQAAEGLERADAAKARRSIELERLVEPADPALLRSAVERAHHLGEMDERIERSRVALEASEAAHARGLERLGLWSGPLEEIDRVAFPEVETLEAHQARFEKVDRRRERLQANAERHAVEARDAHEQLARLRRERAVPSEDDRDALRATRDATWRRIREAWIDDAGRATEPTDAGLPDRFESELAGADEISDRLRSEADRVAQESQLVARLARLDAEASDQARSEAALASDEIAAREDWNGVWVPVGVAPTSPSEMRGWLGRLRSLRDGVVVSRVARDELEGLREQRDAACRDLEQALDAVGARKPERGGSGARLDRWVDTGETVLAELESAHRAATRLREELAEATRASEEAHQLHRRCEAALESWRRDWAEAIEGLGLTEPARPRDAIDRLEILGQLFERIRERDQLAERVEKMESEISRFSKEVAEVVAQCAPGTHRSNPVQAIVELRTSLAEALEQETTRGEIEALRVRAEEEGFAADREFNDARDALVGLREEAGVADDGELELAVQRSRRLVEARRALTEAEGQIAERGEGRSVAALEAEAKEIDPDGIPSRLEFLRLEIDAAEQARDAAREERFRLREVLAKMDGSATVAGLAEEVQAKSASIESDLRRYVTLVLSREILSREIERYRERNQTPVLSRASALFERLTVGAYRGVQSEFDQMDRRQLIAVDVDGVHKQVQALSSGTRDQLFLALRLATLEETLGRGEPMPLIADDILIEFDEDRSRAALEVLADLARKTQILLFSHHAHIAEQAREMGSRACVVSL